MRYKDNTSEDEKPYNLPYKQPILSPERGLERFKERNIVTGVESGQNKAYPLSKPTVPTKEQVEQAVLKKVTDYEKKKKKK